MLTQDQLAQLLRGRWTSNAAKNLLPPSVEKQNLAVALTEWEPTFRVIIWADAEDDETDSAGRHHAQVQPYMLDAAGQVSSALDLSSHHCQLCEYPDLARQFEIRNLHNDNRLWLGCVCITKFEVGGKDKAEELKSWATKVVALAQKRRVAAVFKELEKYVSHPYQGVTHAPKDLLWIFSNLASNGVLFRVTDFKVKLRSKLDKGEMLAITDSEYAVLEQILSSKQRAEFSPTVLHEARKLEAEKKARQAEEERQQQERRTGWQREAEGRKSALNRWLLQAELQAYRRSLKTCLGQYPGRCPKCQKEKKGTKLALVAPEGWIHLECVTLPVPD